MPRSDSERSLQVVGVVPFSNEAVIDGGRTLGSFQDLSGILTKERVDVAVVSPSDVAVTGEVRSAFRTCGELGVTVHYFPSLLDVDHERVRITWGADRHFDIATMTSPKRALALGVKRSLDIVGSSFALLLLAPVFAACAAAVKLTSKGPILFRQTRVGVGGREFACFKFRTMRVGAQAQQELLRASSLQDGPAFKMAGDPRITAVGRLLRKFSLDELPQFLNVLRGDMSLVGPRPPIPTEVDRYEWWQRRRVSVKPGLTCLWQVYGRNKVSFKRWVEMDIYYIDNWSLWMDIKLIAHTVGVVLRGTGM
jgi:exopolysaccharide biosynthesis polyprenyl glycosylphosphotransferase